MNENKDKHKLSEKFWDIIRYHSFYPWHTESEYSQFMDYKDYNTIYIQYFVLPFYLYYL